MWYRFFDVNGSTLSTEEVASNAQALKVAEQLASVHGKVEVWSPVFVVVPEIKYKHIDYSLSKEN